eukprot:SAG31_NODE_3781_length_3885_cov_3.963286_1_plen_127_part_00
MKGMAEQTVFYKSENRSTGTAVLVEYLNLPYLSTVVSIVETLSSTTPPHLWGGLWGYLYPVLLIIPIPSTIDKSKTVVFSGQGPHNFVAIGLWTSVAAGGGPCQIMKITVPGYSIRTGYINTELHT